MSKCTKNCDLMNQIYAGQKNESWFCRTHKKPYYPNTPKQTDTLAYIKKQLYLYRVHCDMALSDRDDGVLTQEEYAQAIERQAEINANQIHACYQAKIREALKNEPDWGNRACGCGFNGGLGVMRQKHPKNCDCNCHPLFDGIKEGYSQLRSELRQSLLGEK